MSTLDHNQNTIIYDEMMSHPVLFSHHHPQKIAIIGDQITGILSQAIKHSSIQEIWVQDSGSTAPAQPNNQKTQILLLDNDLTQIKKEYFDILILATEESDEGASSPSIQVSEYLHFLNHDGILLQQSTSPFDVEHIKNHYNRLKQLKFTDIQLLNFPQPSYPTGWRASFIAVKNNMLKRIREKDIFNRNFDTHYYNFDVHRAAQVLPEFMRKHIE